MRFIATHPTAAGAADWGAAGAAAFAAAVAATAAAALTIAAEAATAAALAAAEAAATAALTVAAATATLTIAAATTAGAATRTVAAGTWAAAAAAIAAAASRSGRRLFAEQDGAAREVDAAEVVDFGDHDGHFVADLRLRLRRWSMWSSASSRDVDEAFLAGQDFDEGAEVEQCA